MDTKQPTSELPNLPKRKRGPKPMAPGDLRVHTVSVRLNPAELSWLNDVRKMVHMERGEYLRHASMGKLPPTIPSINRESWSSLSRVVGNLNQYQAAINGGTATGYPPEVIQSLRDLVQKLRSELIGIDENSESEVEDESQS